MNSTTLPKKKSPSSKARRKTSRPVAALCQRRPRRSQTDATRFRSYGALEFFAVHFYKDASPDGLWNLNSCQKESVSIRVNPWLKNVRVNSCNSCQNKGFCQIRHYRATSRSRQDGIRRCQDSSRSNRDGIRRRQDSSRSSQDGIRWRRDRSLTGRATSRSSRATSRCRRDSSRRSPAGRRIGLASPILAAVIIRQA